MTIGSMMLELFIPASQSLKDKRRVVRSIKDRLHSRYNVAVAEVDHQETHQRARLGIVGITTERLQLEQLFDSIRVDVERNLPGDLVQAEIEILR
jgi:uncharacterized protein YlxP (DUF503 family)